MTKKDLREPGEIKKAEAEGRSLIPESKEEAMGKPQGEKTSNEQGEPGWLQLRDLWQSKTAIPRNEQGIISFEQFLLGFKEGRNWQSSQGEGQLCKHKEALESMVYQFGYRGVKNGRPVIGTGGMSALEEAFFSLGWPDPMEIPEQGNTCEIDGCMEDPCCGQPWGKEYLSLCYKHSAMQREGKERPPIKQYALDREATRDKVTGYLPTPKPQ